MENKNVEIIICNNPINYSYQFEQLIPYSHHSWLALTLAYQPSRPRQNSTANLICSLHLGWLKM
jgi:hypothetical protein